ncbi:NAD-dependent epimerase/dehydratase family protein [Leisingera daeponensis]|uniref:NAD-dependent epimerase/dehydratase family protein n=1 Tax=Leisingera daeponensis TaxID=405746 RepID=A0ABS7ND35_9RHOB|nr:NAD-dependent epimerase/dehydratase family protein [Leisingera daeponensis]MBY6138772.1 NAD-dependent epimerase/dehydratase family protein [Leisingera daeponensis]
MNILILGGTGTIGTAVTQELLRHGHDVTGLSRSDASDRKLEAMGARPLREDLARAYRLLLEAPGLTGHFNASAEAGVPVADITREIARRHGHDGGYVVRSLKHVLLKYGAWAEGPALDQQMGSAKLRSLTGWQPQFSSFRTAQF